MPHQATAQQEQPSSPSVPPALVLHLGDLLLLLAEGPLHHLGPLAELGRDGLQDLAPTQLLQLALRLLLITIPSRHKHTHQTRSSVVEPSKCRDTNIAHQTSSSPLLPPTTLSGLALTWQPRRPHTAWRRAWGVDTRCLLPAPRGRPPRRRPTPRPCSPARPGWGGRPEGRHPTAPRCPPPPPGVGIQGRSVRTIPGGEESQDRPSSSPSSTALLSTEGLQVQATSYQSVGTQVAKTWDAGPSLLSARVVP
jgi:hypothetical protein